MTWLPCGRNLAYEVSTTGQVRRIGKTTVLTAAQNHKQGRPGYFKISLGRRCQVYVHQLVAEAFLGPRPTGHNVDHIDFDRANNSLSNLRYLPKPDNDFRWKSRSADGRNQWTSPHYGDDLEPEEGHSPLSLSELHRIEEDLHSSGW